MKFKGGVTWSYAEVPAEKYRELEEAESVGKYFAAKIRPLHQATRVVEELEDTAS